MENIIELIPPHIDDSDHFYAVANALPLNSENREELIEFIDRMVRYKNMEWIIRILNMHIKKQRKEIRG